MSMFSKLHEFIPKSYLCFREGYSWPKLRDDIFAGITVGIIALPLAMAFAIGSGVPPEKGLFTAIIAGFLISLLGGSRVQIGGPTGAFVVIVYSIVQKHGYDGLAIATLLAGAMMILMGLARFGIFLKFIPYPVTTGFTAGIALVIFSSQINDFFGLSIQAVPADFVEKWILYFKTAHAINWWSFSLAAATLALIFLFRNRYPKLPGTIIAVILATSAAFLFDLPLETIESRFGSIPKTLPNPSFPDFSFEKIQAVFPDAVTIALLGAIESLLSAAVADGLTGHRHRSNCELVAQGFANIGSILFGGIPATGAIARTTTNIKMGAKTPLAGIIHAITLFLLMILFAPIAGKVPLAALASVLVFVAWNMSDLEHFIDILKGQKNDVCLLLITFSLTVLIDLTVAIPVGVILASILFVKRMSDSTTVEVCQLLLQADENEYFDQQDSTIIFRKDVPEGVTIFEIDGPFFFGVSDVLNEELRTMADAPKIFILRMGKVPIIDASGVYALKQFRKKCDQQGIIFLLSGVRDKLVSLLQKTSVRNAVKPEHIFPHLDEALEYSRKVLS